VGQHFVKLGYQLVYSGQEQLEKFGREFYLRLVDVNLKGFHRKLLLHCKRKLKE
jgi:hypothetical protein